jgi:membrane protein implicated in regulation of membrane protease activity
MEGSLMINLHIFFYWIVIAFVLLLFEVGHPGLFFFSAFSAGALITAFASLWLHSWIAQCSVFLVATLSSLFILRYFVAPYIHKGQEHYHSNVYALIGKRGMVLEAITSDTPGKVKVDGEVWVARLIHSNQPIGVGSLVEIVATSGSHLKVKPVS